MHLCDPSILASSSSEETLPQVLPKKRSVFSSLTRKRVLPKKDRTEFHVYNDEEFIDDDNAPLDFWKLNYHRFSQYSQLAKKYLAVPASSEGVERVFSITGALARAKRARLVPKTIENLILFREYTKPKILESLSYQSTSQIRARKKRLSCQDTSINPKIAKK